MSVLLDEAASIVASADWRLTEVLSGELDDLIADLERIKTRLLAAGVPLNSDDTDVGDLPAVAVRVHMEAQAMSAKASRAATLAKSCATQLMMHAGTATDPDTGQVWVWHTPRHSRGGGQILTAEQAADARRKDSSWRGR